MAHRDPNLVEEQKLFAQLMNFMMSKEEEPELLQTLQAKLKRNKMVARMTNKSGYTPLHVGIQHEAPWKKMAMLLLDKEVARQRNPAGRLPLHMALDYYPTREMLNTVIELYPAAVKECDVDTRLPMHIVLEQQPFSVYFADIAVRMIEIFPAAAKVRYTDGRLPLHVALDRSLPSVLIRKIFMSDRTAASVPKRDGKYPLHLALEMEFEVSIVAQLLEAFPKALMIKMPLSGRRLLPLEYAIKKRLPMKTTTTLMDGGASNNARVLAYARAVTTGKIGKDMRAEGSSRGGKVLESTTTVSMHRDSNGVLHMRDVAQATIDEDPDSVKCLLKTDEGLLLTVVCSTQDTVDELKLAVQSAEARALRLQDRNATPPVEQRLLLGTQQLRDGRTLASFHMSKECMIIYQQRCEVFHEALRYGLGDETVKRMLQLRPESAKEEDINGVLPLHLALMHKASASIVMELIQIYPQAAHMQVEGTLGKYPLHLALAEAYPSDTIKSLLKARGHIAKETDWMPNGLYNPAGKDLDPDNSPLPLHMAVQYSMESHVRENITLLLESQCPIGARAKNTGFSALEAVLAAKSGEELFTFVLEKTLEEAPRCLQEESPTGQFPLHVACTFGASVYIVETVCEMYPSATRHFDRDGRLPIHLALINHMSFPVIRYLLQQNPESAVLEDASHHTPIQLAVLHDGSPGTVKEIVRHCPQAVQVRDLKGRSLIEIAVASNAPNWVLHELYEADPVSVQKISILNGNWPTTKAASEIMRMISNRHQDPKNWRPMLTAGDGNSGRRVSRRASRVASKAVPSEPRSLEGPQEETAPAEEPVAALEAEVEPKVQDDAMCEYSCLIS